MRVIASAALAIALTACGGGGGGGGGTTAVSGNPATPTSPVTPTSPPAASSLTIGGNLKYSGTITPNPATTGQTIAVSGTVTIGFRENNSDITIPFTVSRTTAGGTTYNGSVTLHPTGLLDWTGSVSFNIPAGQPVGAQSYCISFQPGQAYNYTGNNNGDTCTSVQVNP